MARDTLSHENLVVKMVLTGQMVLTRLSTYRHHGDLLSRQPSGSDPSQHLGG